MIVMTPKRIDRDDWNIGALWRFDTARFTVALFAEDEDTPPKGHFCDPRDEAFASDGDPAHWFCAVVAIYDENGERIAHDVLGGCSYNSFREFYSAHRWQYSRRAKGWITDPKSRVWKACEARRPRRLDGSRMDGHYFPDMVRTAIGEARAHLLRLQHTAA